MSPLPPNRCGHLARADDTLAGSQSGGEGPNDWQMDIIAKVRAIYRDARLYRNALNDAHCHAPQATRADKSMRRINAMTTTTG